MISRTARYPVAALVVAALVLVLTHASASAQNGVQVTQAGTISGSPLQVGTTLTASGGSWNPASANARWEWFACPAKVKSWSDCELRAVSQSQYTIQSGDVGRYIVLNLYAWRTGQPVSPTAGRERAEKSTTT